MKSRIATCLWYDGQAEEAAELYTSLISNSEITSIMRPDPDGPALMVEFTLDGTAFQALNGGPEFMFTEATSISVATQNQQETDRLWQALTSDGGAESQCGWLKDRFGLSWQIIPEVLPYLVGSNDRPAAERATQAMLKMRKIDIAALEAAYRGE